MKNFFKKLMSSKSQSKYFSETVQRVGKNNAGFSLVELIVVIAIMAILAAVAVIGVSVYIPKAQKAADQQLVSDIKQALTLHYYSNPANATNDYVILSSGNAQVGSTFAEQAMSATFGQGWAEKCTLAYEDWTDDGILAMVIGQGSNVNTNIANSSFLTQSTPADLIDAFSTVTNGLSGMAQSAGQDPLYTISVLGVLSDEQVDEVRAEMNSLGLSWDSSAGADNSAYSTALSNVLVKHTATEVGNIDLEADENLENSSGLASIAINYSIIYAAAANGSAECKKFLSDFETLVADENTTAQDVLSAFENAPELDDEYLDGAYNNDVESVITLMGSVGEISKDFSMTTEGLYSSEEIAGKVNDYTSAVSVVSGLTPDQLAVLKQLSGGEVVIFITSTGSISVVPMEANPAA